MPYPYKKVFKIGATSGIGKALTQRLASNGVHVVASGRRAESLDSLQQEFGKDKISTIKLDITDLDQVFVNAGIQRGMDFTKPASLDFQAFQDELTTNYTAAVKLTMAFLPFLQGRDGKASLV
jgi:NADP-dependent 3-hydroxy acid dehydrogenase YdfG